MDPNNIKLITASLAERRQADILVTVDVADLFAELLNVLREDVYASQILEIKAYLQRLSIKETPNSMASQQPSMERESNDERKARR